MNAVEPSPDRRRLFPYCGIGGEGNMSRTSKLCAALISALIVTVLSAAPASAHHAESGLSLAGLPGAMGSDHVSASIASAAAATTIDAVDSPGPAWEPA